MYRKVLRKLELETLQKIKDEEQKLWAIQSIQKLIDGLDHSAELIPENDTQKFVRFLEDLEGVQLSEEEKKVILKI